MDARQAITDLTAAPAPRPAAAPGPAPAPAAAPAGPWRPGTRWPTVGQLGYVRELVIVLVLLLALPFVVSKLLTNPREVVAGANPVRLP